MARAASANSASVVGGASGSRPASSKSALLYIHTDRSMMNGRPYLAPSQVDPTICAWPTSSMNGRLSIFSVISVNSPAMSSSA